MESENSEMVWFYCPCYRTSIFQYKKHFFHYFIYLIMKFNYFYI